MIPDDSEGARVLLKSLAIIGNVIGDEMAPSILGQQSILWRAQRGPYALTLTCRSSSDGAIKIALGLTRAVWSLVPHDDDREIFPVPDARWASGPPEQKKTRQREAKAIREWLKDPASATVRRHKINLAHEVVMHRQFIRRSGFRTALPSTFTDHVRLEKVEPTAVLFDDRSHFIVFDPDQSTTLDYAQLGTRNLER